MSREYFGIKELYDVTLKTTSDMKVGNRSFEEGEPLLYFDKIQIASIDEDISRFSATGGKSNRNLIIWEDTKEVSFTLQEGVLSRLSFAMLTNASVISRDENNDYVIVPKRELFTTDGDGKVELKYEPMMDEAFFVYNEDVRDNEKVEKYRVNGKVLTLPDHPYTSGSVSYYFSYRNKFDAYHIGEKLFNGYLRLEGKVYFKEDEGGLNKTTLFEMPRVRLMSGLNMRVGERADPVVSTFEIAGFPQSNQDKTICKITLLDDDVDYDI